jgi:hypothetical protein
MKSTYANGKKWRKSISTTKDSRRRDRHGRPWLPRRLAYGIDELVKFVGVGRSTLYAEMAAGRLKGSKVGRRTIVTRANAVAWLRTVPPA